MERPRRGDVDFECRLELPQSRGQQAIRRALYYIEAACRHRFRGAQYRHVAVRHAGAVGGQRYHVTGTGFEGVVSVQWCSRGPSYRHGAEDRVRLRVGGSFRSEPTPPPAEADPHRHGRALAILLAGVLMILGLRGGATILAHPSWFVTLDVAAYLVASAMIGVAAGLAVAAVHRLKLPRARPKPKMSSADLDRWRALGAEITRLSQSLAY